MSTLPAEIVVVGGGPGGLNAALWAARAGARVLLLDGYTRPGGQYFRQPPERLMNSATHKQRQGHSLWQQVLHAGVEVRSETLVWNAAPDRSLAVAGPGGTRMLRPEAVILATGTYERVAAFPGWTLPGVITSGATQTLLYQQVLPGKRVLLAGTGPLQLTTAAELLHAGAQVVAVLEGARLLAKGLSGAPALWGQWERAFEGAESLWTLARHAVPYRTGWGIVSAHGSDQVQGATIARLDSNWRPIPGSEQQVECDTICVGFGFVPFNALSRLAGAAQAWRPALGGEVPLRDANMQTSVPGIYAVGDGAGVGGYRLALLEGQIAGLAAAHQMGKGQPPSQQMMVKLQRSLQREHAFQQLYGKLFLPGPGIYELANDDTLICRCEGVTLGDIRRAVSQQAASTITELKNITRCGMGECQGRVCGSTLMHSLARLAGVSPEQVGLNAPRPPIFALPLAMLLPEEEPAG